MKMNNLSCLLFFLFFTSILSAQKSPIKFGKVSKEDLEMTTYEADPEAHAVILCDYGRTRFEYDTQGDRGFYLVFDRVVRVKILDEAGLDWADWSISLYQSGGTAEKVKGLKGYTFNLEGGTIQKEKLSSKEVFREEVSDYRRRVKFAMPNVQVGSVIDIKYSIESDFTFNLQEWQFQYSIPTVWSEYRAEIPEFYYYNKTLKGYESARLTVREEKDLTGKITFMGFNRSNRLNTSSRATSNTVDFKTTAYRWAVENMPAFKTEDYMTSINNYLTVIDFELSYSRFPGGNINYYTEDWPSIIKLLRDNDRFGRQLKKLNFLKEEVEQFKSQYPDPKERLVAIHDFVRTNMKWNDENAVLTSNSLKKVFEKGIGNSADINLLLTLLLKKADLDAAPVTLSTRQHGILNPSHPSINQFNYVVAGVRFGEDYILLDATSNYRSAKLLPFRCLNGKGRWINLNESDGEGVWVPIHPGGGYKKVVAFDVKINEEEETFKGTMTRIQKDYAALSMRRQLAGKTDEATFVKDLEKAHEGLKIEKHEIKEANKIYKDVREDYDVEISERMNVSGDFIYFTPLLFFAETETPFKLATRNYPIDYGYPHSEMYSMKFTIPEGYEVDEMPEKAVIALPEKGGKFTFHVSRTTNQIVINSKFSIKQTLFLSQDYEALKQFYNMMIEKHAEQVVLKKKT